MELLRNLGQLQRTTTSFDQMVCLQETFLKANNNINIKNYKSYNHIHNTSHKVLEGVSILIRNDTPQSKINCNIGLQAIAIKVTLHRTINICTLYITPHDTINKKELNILQQLPTPYILLGNFNSHNTIWSCKSKKEEHWKIFSIMIIYVSSTQNLKHILTHFLLPTQL